MGKTIELSAADGHRFAAYLAEPAGQPRAALVVVQEIFGVNSHIRAVADGYAADGYLVLAPALFDRVERGVELAYSEGEVARGRELKLRSGNDAPLQDIAAALARLRSMLSGGAGQVGIVGYCWGGLLAWLSACKLDGFSSSVPYYGGGMPEHAALAPRCPVLAHFGERDHLISLDQVRAFARAHETSQPAVQVQLYAADHGFNCDQRAAFDAAAAALARQRTLAFFVQHLG